MIESVGPSFGRIASISKQQADGGLFQVIFVAAAIFDPAQRPRHIGKGGFLGKKLFHLAIRIRPGVELAIKLEGEVLPISNDGDVAFARLGCGRQSGALVRPRLAEDPGVSSNKFAVNSLYSLAADNGL